MAFPRSRVLPYTILQQTPASAGPSGNHNQSSGSNNISDHNDLHYDDEPDPEPPRPPTPSPTDYLFSTEEPLPQPSIIPWPAIHDPNSARVSVTSQGSTSNRCNTPSNSSVRPSSHPSSQLRDLSLDLSRPKLDFNYGNLHLICHGLSHPGSQAFFSVKDAGNVLSRAVERALELLYSHRSLGQSPRCITLKLCSMDGVAFTKGSELDDLHKEIHLSSDYLSKVSPELLQHEVAGVVLHEAVHCLQWHGQGTAPSGLIEGIADWVRLKANLSPPHWKRSAEGRWDQGYEKTAYFLDWLAADEKDALIRVNHYLKDHKYEEDQFWPRMFGGDVGILWRQYGQALKMEELEKQVESETRRPAPFRASRTATPTSTASD